MNITEYYKPELGILATPEVRYARIMAHKSFDCLWKNTILTRKSAYKWLAVKMDMSESACHMKLMSESQCYKVVKICDEALIQYERNK